MKNTRTFHCLVALLLVSSISSIVQAQTCSVQINPDKELVITDLSVVNDHRATDPSGVWTFGRMMRSLSPQQVDPSDFTMNWLKQWSGDQTVNGFNVAARPTVSNIISSWPKNQKGKLDLTKSPFRLLAITNRVDIFNGPAGEGRFVFGALDASGSPLPFTVIFEFLLPPPQSGIPVIAWAKQWHALGALSFGDTYNAALEKLTNIYVGVSKISQVRTNEIALAAPWEMREFHLSVGGALENAGTKQMPDESFLTSSSLAGWIRRNADMINSNTHVVPAKILGGSGHSPVNWQPALANDPDQNVKNARHNFALQTCTGCHSTETQTAFLHVANRAANQASTLSAFLKSDIVQRQGNMKSLLCLSPQKVLEKRKAKRRTRVH